jgi:hypothetical protein
LKKAETDKSGSIKSYGMDANGNHVLFAYLIDMPALKWLKSSLYDNRSATVVCFEFQKEVLSKYCGELVKFELLDFTKFKEVFFP